MIVAIGAASLDDLSWFFLTTSIANPIGSALGQLLSPAVGDSRQSVCFCFSISLHSHITDSDSHTGHHIDSNRTVHPRD